MRVGVPFTLEELESEVATKDVSPAPAERGASSDSEKLVSALMLRIAALLSPPYRGVYADVQD